MLTDSIKKIKLFISADAKDARIALLIILIIITSFGSVRFLQLQQIKTPLVIESESGAIWEPRDLKTAPNISERSQNLAGKYIASKNGKFYHYPWCNGGSKIKEENIIWFNTKEGAEKAGFKPASNCPGL